MKREPLRRVVWRRVQSDGTTTRPTKTALRPHEEENVRAGVRLLRRRLRTWVAVSAKLGKTMDRVMRGERRVQDRWATLVARALSLPVDDVISGVFPQESRCPTWIRMSNRRMTRLTNAFSKKLENHKAAMALRFANYNLCRVHRSLRITPAVAAGVTDHVWSVEELLQAAGA